MVSTCEWPQWGQVMRDSRITPALSPRPRLMQGLERRPHLRSENQRLLPRCEVAALFRLVEVGQVRIATFRPTPRGLVDLAGEDGEPGRDGEFLRAEIRGLVVP